MVERPAQPYEPFTFLRERRLAGFRSQGEVAIARGTRCGTFAMGSRVRDTDDDSEERIAMGGGP
jgi:hypothetical protein